MTKGIKLSGNPLQIKCKLIMDCCFSGASESELKLVMALVETSTGNSLAISPALSKQIAGSSGLSVSALSTYLHRLEKKGAVNRSGRTVMLHPVFNGLLESDKILISFIEG